MLAPQKERCGGPDLDGLDPLPWLDRPASVCVGVGPTGMLPLFGGTSFTAFLGTRTVQGKTISLRPSCVLGMRAAAAKAPSRVFSGSRHFPHAD